jgi:hypothetical protein
MQVDELKTGGITTYLCNGSMSLTNPSTVNVDVAVTALLRKLKAGILASSSNEMSDRECWYTYPAIDIYG